ncbi:MAG: DUF4097 family beta strand repeat protein [Chloroflexi bacterium]|nr:DUF4097 family beta strand repeat protein [Chloroflexota bacterium]
MESKTEEFGFKPHGDFKAEEGDFKGDFKAEKGDFKAEKGDFKAEEGDFKAEEGDFKAEEGDFKAEEGDFKGDFKAEEGDFKVEYLDGTRKEKWAWAPTIVPLGSVLGGLVGHLTPAVRYGHWVFLIGWPLGPLITVLIY